VLSENGSDSSGENRPYVEKAKKYQKISENLD
jgi:hypothetical protein